MNEISTNKKQTKIQAMHADPFGRKILTTMSGAISGGILAPVVEWMHSVSALPLMGLSDLIENPIAYSERGLVATTVCSLGELYHTWGDIGPTICHEISIRTITNNTIAGLLIGGAITGVIAFRNEIAGGLKSAISKN